ncbi:uncharacterized protein LOC134248514, partial [Saccostrea cucullata]|uniref:uncharacterized protein LOC134248514 n=1 Tax=Saccostrea cuccullata TaxID=36930 RepID=UPI002ECFBE8A
SVEKQVTDGLWTDLIHSAKGRFLPSTWPKTIQDIKECLYADVPENEYRLIFYALLIHKHYNGARQWIRTGFVSIPHILVGAFIIKQKQKKWQTGQIEKDYLQRIYKTITEDAVRIISCIYDNDSRHAPEEKHSKENVLHSGRILLNHKCLSDAMETGNTMFVENEVIQDILNKMWYGKSKDLLTICEDGQRRDSKSRLSNYGVNALLIELTLTV